MTRCDSHVHVVGDAAGLLPDRTYTPPPAPLEALQAAAATAGVERFVVVQPSFYGTDNTVTLAALDTLGDRGRGVAVVDPATDDATLADLHRRGVRGLRVNLYSTLSAKGPSALDDAFEAAALLAARMGWHVEVLAALATLVRHADRLAAAPVPVVLDHYGLYGGVEPTGPAGQALLALLGHPHVWMKLSAPYRVEPDPLARHPDPAWLAAILAVTTERCVWGSDWPHTPPHELQSGGGIPLPYRALDYTAVVEGFRQAVGVASGAALADKIMTANPAQLYGFS